MLQYFLSRNLNSKQSVKLSILLTLSKYFTNPKCVFMFDLISSFVESSITTKKKKLTKLFFCFLLSCKRTVKELHLSKDSSDSFCLTVRYRRYLGQDTGTVIVLCLGHCRRYRRYHYSYMGTRPKSCFGSCRIWQ